MSLYVTTDAVLSVLRISLNDWAALKRVLRPPLVIVRDRNRGVGRGRGVDHLSLAPLIEFLDAVNLIEAEQAAELARLSAPLD